MKKRVDNDGHIFEIHFHGKSRAKFTTFWKIIQSTVVWKMPIYEEKYSLKSYIEFNLNDILWKASVTFFNPDSKMLKYLDYTHLHHHAVIRVDSWVLFQGQFNKIIAKLIWLCLMSIPSGSKWIFEYYIDFIFILHDSSWFALPPRILLKSISPDYQVRTWEKVPWRAILNICLCCLLSQKENT